MPHSFRITFFPRGGNVSVLLEEGKQASMCSNALQKENIFSYW